MITVQSSLSEWLCYIENLSRVEIDLNLDRVRVIAIKLNLIYFDSYVIIVGGTNGKGTTCCLLEKILLNNKISVGLYTSPHLLSYNERVRINGLELSDKEHIQAMFAIEKGRGDIALTYFEFITLSALYIFKQKMLDIIILEVGLGGRLDATNIVNVDLSVITNVAIDHTDVLGDDRNIIAIEKSGIFRANKLAIIGEKNYPIILKKMAELCGSRLFACGRDWNFCVLKNQWFWWDYNYQKVLCALPLPIVPIENAALVLSVLFCLPFVISKVSIFYGLKTANLLGRFQIVSYRPIVILDVGHNPHAANYLLRRLSEFSPYVCNFRMIIGMMKRKDSCNTIRILSRIIDMWYFTDLNTSLSAHATKFSYYIYNTNFYVFSHVLDAWNKAVLDSKPDDCIIVFGSFYTVRPILQLLMKHIIL